MSGPCGKSAARPFCIQALSIVSQALRKFLTAAVIAAVSVGGRRGRHWNL